MSWGLKKLGDLCWKITDGSHNPPKGVEQSEYMMLSSKNVFDDKITFEQPRFLTREDFEKENKRTDVCENDILLTIVGTVGRAAVVPKNVPKFTLQRSVAVLKPNLDLVDSRFLMYSLQNIVTTLMEGARGVAQKGIYLKSIREITIVAPPLKEQKRIAAILDKADAIRRKRQQAIDLTDQLLRSVFLDMFGDPVTNPKGWEKIKLGELCGICRGGSPRPIQKYLGGTVPWIKIGDATKSNDIYLDKTKEKIYESGMSKTRYLQPGALIFANCGVSLGFARILKIAGCIHDGWLALKINDKRLNQLFLLKALNKLTKYFQSIAPDGTQPNLNTAIMKDFELILPPVELQKKFENIVSKVNSMRVAYVDVYEVSDNAFNSLTQNAFNGELIKQSKAA